MILMIDNYDSFTYNLVHYLGELGAGCEVYRNDQIDLQAIREKEPRYLIISPGPCTPKEAGISEEVILDMSGKIPILGVCLGHQCIGSAFGGRVVRAERLMHGKSSLIYHDGKTIYRGLPNPFRAIRYHSLLIEREDLPDCLEVSSGSFLNGVTLGDYTPAAESHGLWPWMNAPTFGRDVAPLGR